MSKWTTRQWASVGLSAALLVALLMVGGFSLKRPAGVQEYLADVRETVQAIPFRIDGWNGRRVPATPSVRRLLRPNVIFQRQYTDDEGRSIALLIVHCGNVRDMDGHYPPICYPGRGWDLLDTSDREIMVGDTTVTARDYSFVREQALQKRSLLVTQFFVLPDEGRQTHVSIKALQAASRSPVAAGLGAGQIQIVTDEDVDPSSWDEILETFVSECLPVIEAIGEGADAR